jgi:Mlc titration factor MtfA (ptsG expression regulator)
MPSLHQRLSGTARLRLRTLTDEARLLLRSGFALTADERETVALICALFVLGLAIRWIRWWLAD